MSYCWSRISTLKFIKKYRSLDSIWNVKSKEYHNRDKKDIAYTDLLDVVKKFDPQATKDTVVKKINNLRSAFRKELKKVNFAQRSGWGTYVPRLWYYSDLLFLVDQEEALEGTPNVEESDKVGRIIIIWYSYVRHSKFLYSLLPGPFERDV